MTKGFPGKIISIQTHKEKNRKGVVLVPRVTFFHDCLQRPHLPEFYGLLIGGSIGQPADRSVNI
jgi:hypothetical protein